MENFENEYWVYVPDFDNKYMASNYGRIKGTEYYGKGIGKGCFRKGNIFKPDIIGKDNNYKKPRVCLNGKKYNVSVIVAKSFPEICGVWFYGAEVHHIDLNPENNKPENLKVVTKEEHKLIHRSLGKNVGEKNPFYGKHHTKETIRKANNKRRKPVYQYSLEGVCLCYWFSCTDCERETGMKKSAINRCCIGKQNIAYGYIWKYAKEGEN